MNYNDESFDIVDIIKYFIAKLKIMIIITLAVMIVGNIYYLIKSKKYTSNVTVTIPTDIATYAEHVKSEVVLKDTINDLNMDKMTTKQLAGYINATVTSGTKNLVIKVTTNDASLSEKITLKLVKSYAKYLRTNIKMKNVKIASKVNTSTKPDGSNYKKQFIVFAAAGIAVSCIVVFAMYYFDNKIKTKKDIEEKLKLHNIGEIYKIKDKKLYEITKHNENQFKSIRKNIEFNLVGKEPKIIMITSLKEKEGKTYIANRLAESYALDKQKVLIINSNLRKQDDSKKKGYSDLILEYKANTKLENYISKYKSNVDIIYNTQVVENPEEIIKSNNNQKLINRLAKKYNVIIFDCNNIDELNNPFNYAKYSNINLLVVEYNKIKVEEIQEQLNKLKEENKNNKEEIKITGTILNKIKE